MDTNQLNAMALIVESKVISDEFVHAFNNKLAAALADGWVQHGNMFAVGTQYTVNVVKYDPRFTKVINGALALAALQLEELGNLV